MGEESKEAPRENAKCRIKEEEPVDGVVKHSGFRMIK
jgi:hypothetical protein